MILYASRPLLKTIVNLEDTARYVATQYGLYKACRDFLCFIT
jgi:hypothetical protein